MFVSITHCPNPACSLHEKAPKGFFIKKGYFRTAHNRQHVPRYQCKTCKKLFSTRTMSSTYKQKKPEINQKIYKWYCSATTQRRMARVLGINRKTVIRKFLFMARQARKEHEKRVHEGQIKTTFVQFDEMETFEHTRLKPLSIAIAVRAKTGEIIEAQVSSKTAHGYLAKLAQQKYGFRQDTREAAREDVFKMINRCGQKDITVMTDKAGHYPYEILKFVPGAKIEQVKSTQRRDRSTDSDRRNKDPRMFMINSVQARIRHDLSRMARRVWVTTKRPEFLQAHLDLYIAFNNKYELK